MSIRKNTTQPISTGPLHKTCKMQCRRLDDREQRCYFEGCDQGEMGDRCQTGDDCKEDLICDNSMCVTKRSTYLMVGGKQPSDASKTGQFPQFEISLVELVNDQLEKTMLSTKSDRMRNMPKSGFYRHCTAKLGDYFYVIGGGQPANLEFQLCFGSLVNSVLKLKHTDHLQAGFGGTCVDQYRHCFATWLLHAQLYDVRKQNLDLCAVCPKPEGFVRFQPFSYFFDSTWCANAGHLTETKQRSSF